MAKNKKAEHIWKDRKRYLGLPLSFTKYAVKDQRLYYTKGFLIPPKKSFSYIEF